jgi:hypothetical protein
MTTYPTEAAPVEDLACYVYGIVPADASLDGLEDSGMGEAVVLVADGPVGALVEAVDPERPLGRRRDLVAHSTVLNTMAERGPVLPLRFGSVVHDEHVVRQELLAPQRDHFSALLADVAGKVQFTLRARYELDAVLAEVVDSEPEVAELRRRTAGLPEEATHYDRVRLGELVAQAVDVRRRQDAQQIRERLAPHALDHVVREVSGMDSLAELSFLVDTEHRDDLEGAAEQLAAELDGRARLSLVGPMALYDFVPEQ